MTFIVALIAFSWLSKGPGTAWWLESGEEREWAEKRVILDRYGHGEPGLVDPGRRPRGNGGEAEVEELLREDGVEPDVVRDADALAKVVGGEAKLTKRDIIEAFRDWKIWWILVVNICSSVPGAAFSVFLPLVVKVCPTPLSRTTESLFYGTPPVACPVARDSRCAEILLT